MRRTGLLAAGLGLMLYSGSRIGYAATPGDLNGDGAVNVADVILSLRLLVGLDASMPDRIHAGDVAPVTGDGVYGDGKVDLLDIRRLLLRAVGQDQSPGWPGRRAFDAVIPPPTAAVSALVSEQTATGDEPLNLSLRGGYMVEGNIAGTHDARVSTEQLTFVNTQTGETFSPRILGNDTYSTALPPGSYQIFYAATINVTVTANDPSTQFFSFMKFPLQTMYVEGPVHTDLTRPTLPPLHRVEGQTLLNGQPTTAMAFALTFERLNSTSSTTPNPTVTVSWSPPSSEPNAPKDSHFTALLPGGDYKVTATPQIEFLDSLRATVVDAQFRVAADTDHDFNVPTLPPASPSIQVTGKVTAGGAPLASGSLEAYFVRTVPGINRNQAGAGPVTDGAYTLSLPPEPLNLVFTLFLAVDDKGNFTYWTYTVPVDPSQETVKNVAIPLLPTPVTQTGKLTAPAGLSVGAVQVTLTSTQLDDMPSNLAYSTQTLTDAAGNFTVSAPIGAYKVQATVPQIGQ